ncbi:MAG TPA: DDE-type integrase/transposase/recombinase [Thermoanaerobaculia bacterium]|nr:DDE-type integrase/transposase/recombinase [Thermoanaerobaculia bacterium]
MSPADSLAESNLDRRALAALARSRNFSDKTVKLLLRTKELLLLGQALLLGQWRDSPDRAVRDFACHCAVEIKCDELREIVDLTRGRFLRIRAAHRPHYTPEERFRIVVFIRTHSYTIADAAATFMVDPNTIGRWIREATREPDKNTVGSLLKAAPPVRTKSDVTRALVALLDRMKVGGSRTIAQMLVRAGKDISHETVRRLRKNPPPPPATPAPDTRRKEATPLRAKEPNHIWMTDITTIPSLFRLWFFKLVVILDVYSRFPLAFRVFTKEPTSAEIAQMVDEAAAKHGKPKHFVTDRGSQFTCGAFVDKLRAMRIAQRFGAVGRTGSIAIIERFWRTMKEMLGLRILPPLSRAHLEEQVRLGLFFYASLRPHQGLGGATPAEIYFSVPAPHEVAASPPAGNARDPSAPDEECVWRLAYVTGDHRFPFLTDKIAA